MNEELLNKIIDVAYRNASVWKKFEIYFLAFKNSEVKNTLAEYKVTAKKVKNLEIEDCPENIINNVAKIIKSENINSHSLISDIYNILFNRPLLSGTMATVFILAIISTFVFQRPEIKEHYTKQEIEIAEKQTRETFELIASVLNKTKNTVEQEVLAKRVSKPIKQSLNLVNDYLEGENKNENIN
ncbi:MAG: hypothetical protein IPM32_04255 [Ignavibacteriae bacterium]|nr:hypothetical protein [Ignavibacteriota bacterium]